MNKTKLQRRGATKLNNTKGNPTCMESCVTTFKHVSKTYLFKFCPHTELLQISKYWILFHMANQIPVQNVKSALKIVTKSNFITSKMKPSFRIIFGYYRKILFYDNVISLNCVINLIRRIFFNFHIQDGLWTATGLQFWFYCERYCREL